MLRTMFWLLSILIVTYNYRLSEGILIEKWIEQRQDHFDSSNDNTWLMRYYEDDEFYEQSGPIFITIGGEIPLTRDVVKGNHMMHRMAENYQAIMYSIEHRYYGKSQPVPDTSLENLKYLSVPQVLADIAFFIGTKKRELNHTNAFTVVFGCSYAGNLAAWMRIAYPNLVDTAVASSAPIYIKANFFEFFFYVENSIRDYDENCAMNIEAAFSALDDLFENPEINSIKVKNDFNLCSPAIFEPSDISLMFYALAKMITVTILWNRKEKNGKTPMENLCSAMKGNDTESSYYRLATLFKKHRADDPSCPNFSYTESLRAFVDISWESKAITERVWSYQVCMEFGYFMTLQSPASMFGYRVPLKYFVKLCEDIFGLGFNLHNLELNIHAINYLYNSELPVTTNIIFINGDNDPWRSLSVLSDLNTDSLAITINGGTHCEIEKQGLASDKNSIIAARCQVSFIIYEWFHKWRKEKNLAG